MGSAWLWAVRRAALAARFPFGTLDKIYESVHLYGIIVCIQIMQIDRKWVGEAQRPKDGLPAQELPEWSVTRAWAGWETLGEVGGLLSRTSGSEKCARHKSTTGSLPAEGRGSRDPTVLSMLRGSGVSFLGDACADIDMWRWLGMDGAN
jgi:hypothetical protein